MYDEESDQHRGLGTCAAAQHRPRGRTAVQRSAAVLRDGALSVPANYGGVRLKFAARVGKARAVVQLDVGFGDVVTPETPRLTYPTLLEFPAPTLNAYTPETMIAEKLEAMISIGAATTRMKDFYDIWFLAGQCEFTADILGAAIRRTFERRDTLIPNQLPDALSDAFVNDESKRQQWNAFVRKARIQAAPALDEAVTTIREFIRPILGHGATVDEAVTWPPGGPWEKAGKAVKLCPHSKEDLQ